MSPKSLFAAATPATGAVLSRDECQTLLARTLSFATSPTTVVAVESSAAGTTRLARSTVSTGSDAFEIKVKVRSTIDGKTGESETTQTDDASLREVVGRAEAIARVGPKRYVLHLVDRATYGDPSTWYESAASIELEARTDVAHTVASALEKGGVIGAGSLGVSAMSKAVANPSGVFAYSRVTNVSLSVSARAADGTGSGWAGVNAFDWSAVDGGAIAEQAMDRCRRSLRPVAIEPGRYTTILEPAAYSTMMYWLMFFHMDRPDAEQGYSTFARKGGGTKIGLRVFDPHLSLVSDPADSIGPFIPFDDDARPRLRTPWIDHGVLTTLAYDADYGEKHQLPGAIDNPISVRLVDDRAPTAVEEMIAGTERGVYVIRAAGVNFAHFRTMTCSGVTRDGFWLIENGKITKPIKNFRFMDSPLFFLNEVEQAGPPQLAMIGDKYTYVLPALKVRDFNFTSLADAI